jgi:hypothetical protein
MSSSKLYAFAADGEVYPCQNPANTAVCQALLDKSETYPDTGKDHYRRKAYREAAETVTVLLHSIPAACAGRSGGRIDEEVVKYFGPRTSQFIIDYCRENPLPAPGQPSIYQQMHAGGCAPKCAHKDNQPIWDTLIKKAASYPPEKKYNKQAVLIAASKVLNIDYSIPSLEFGRGTSWGGLVKLESSGLTQGMADFIADYCIKHREPASFTKHKDNQPLYDALVKKAASYPPEKKYNNHAYLRAAAEVLGLSYSLPALEWNDPLSNILCVPGAFRRQLGPKTFQFIRDFYTTERPVRCAANQRVYKTIKEALFLNQYCRENLALSIASLAQPLTKETVDTALPSHFPMIRAVVKAAL